VQGCNEIALPIRHLLTQLRSNAAVPTILLGVPPRFTFVTSVSNNGQIYVQHYVDNLTGDQLA